MLRRCAARNSEDTSGSGSFLCLLRQPILKISLIFVFHFLPVTLTHIMKVQIVQLLPKLFRGTKQMHLHGSNIQLQDLGDFRQAPIFIMPQCECGALAEAQPCERACQPLIDLAGEELVLGVRMRWPRPGSIWPIRPRPWGAFAKIASGASAGGPDKY